jgi:hypothetical protein
MNWRRTNGLTENRMDWMIRALDKTLEGNLLATRGMIGLAIGHLSHQYAFRGMYQP